MSAKYKFDSYYEAFCLKNQKKSVSLKGLNSKTKNTLKNIHSLWDAYFKTFEGLKDRIPLDDRADDEIYEDYFNVLEKIEETSIYDPEDEWIIFNETLEEHEAAYVTLKGITKYLLM